MKRFGWTVWAAGAILSVATAGEVPSWKVICGETTGPEGRAAELVTSDVGEILLREPGVYATHVLPVWRAADEPGTNGNVILVGTLADNPALARYVKDGDVPAGGYFVKTFAEGGRSVVVIAGSSPVAALWGAADFVGDGIPALRPDRGNNLRYERDVFFRGKTIGRYESRRAPASPVRSVFTWGHPIDDYRAYLRNLARLRLNRVYLWNDYPPVNAKEIVDYAHSWGVEVFWGFHWGWSTDCKSADRLDLAQLSAEILAAWRKTWKDLPGDGIYFQTFTERFGKDDEKDRTAARAVELVNRTAAAMLAEAPAQRIVFGLHAAGVRNHLDDIARTDPRLEILWEDTGLFPYSLGMKKLDGLGSAFTQKVLSDAARPVGIVWKSQMIQDWSNWTYQEGPFVLGSTSRKTYADDVAIQSALWREFEKRWIAGFDVAYEEAKRTHAIGPRVEMNLAAQLNGPIRLPTAIAAELFWDASEPKEKILDRVLSRRFVE